MSNFEKWSDVLAESRRLLAQPIPAAEPKPAATPDRSVSSKARRDITGTIYKRRDDALITSAEPEVTKGDAADDAVSGDDDLSDLPAQASAYATANTPATAPWWQWVERHCEYRIHIMREAVGEVLGTFQADTHDEVDAVASRCSSAPRVRSIHPGGTA
jgi:hypothetical protein